ncbi:lysophosphatidic acid receptor 6-like [Patella vulgata]|uniref:lysophosphatidic acid receptor 6-like n=1 Tax=Patella vulgata TaxID=6465 RepID=UPI0021807B20|nr:lysophosphatidic acid receptor 6-like [Patella vulgata]
MEYHVPLALLINKCLTPIWYLVGGIGNIVSARIWFHPRMKASNISANYLAALAIADFIYLFLHVFYELENPWLMGTLDLPIWCELWNMLYMSIQYLCVLLVLAFTTERFLSVCHPFKSERFSRKTRSTRVIVLFFIVALLFGSPQAYFWQVSETESVCFVRYSISGAGGSFYTIYTWGSEMIMFGVIPLVVLSLNICVLLRIKTAGQLNIREARTNQPGHASVTTTITLLCVSFYLIVTTLPVTITFAIQNNIVLGPPMPISQMGDDPVWTAYFNYYSARTIIKEICMSHHVSNLFIYYATSKSFRKRIKECLLCSSKYKEGENRQYPSLLLQTKVQATNQ